METEAVPKDPNAHNYRYVEGSGTTPTCTEDGNGNEVCPYDASHTRSGVTIPALGHDYEWETTTHATCSAKGIRTGTCTRDASHTTTEDIPINPDAHDWQAAPGSVAPTCTTAGSGTVVCSYNSEHTQTASVIPALGHDSGEWHITLTAACTTTGTRQLRCTRDDAVLNTETVAALGHNVESWTQTTAPTCTTAGSETGTCTHDGSTQTRAIAIDPTAHDWNGNWEITIPPTLTGDGVETDTCAHDPSHTRTRSITTVTFDSIASLGTYLSNRSANTTATAYKVSLNVSNLGGSYATSGSLGYALNANITKYVNLDLSGSTFTEIGTYAFYSCTSLTSITIPDTVTSIGLGAFQSCTGLTSITIPNSVTSIGDSAFDRCTSLTSITIPDSVTSIQNGAFAYCTSLTAINVDAENTAYSSQDGVLFNKTKTTLIVCPAGKTGTYIIPNGVTSIGQNAFNQCAKLTSITIPEGVTSINGNYFFECSSLTSITLPSSITNISGAFEGSSTNNFKLDNLVLFICPAVTPPTIQGFSSPPPMGDGSIRYSTFDYTPNMQIKVPASSVDAYKATTGWSKWADKISAIE